MPRCTFCSASFSFAHVAVVCLASAPYKEPLNGGACAATARHELSDVLKNGSATPSSQLTTKCVRVNVLHEHICALNSHVLDLEWGSWQFREQNHQNKLLTGKTSRVMCVCGVGCWLLVVGCWLLVVGCWLLVVGCCLLVVGRWSLVVGHCRCCCWLTKRTVYVNMLLRSRCAGALDGKELFTIEGSENWRSTPDDLE